MKIRLSLSAAALVITLFLTGAATSHAATPFDPNTVLEDGITPAVAVDTAARVNRRTYPKRTHATTKLTITKKADGSIVIDGSICKKKIRRTEIKTARRDIRRHMLLPAISDISN